MSEGVGGCPSWGYRGYLGAIRPGASPDWFQDIEIVCGPRHSVGGTRLQRDPGGSDCAYWSGRSCATMAMLCALLEVAILVGLGAGCGGGWRRPLTRVTLQLYHFCVFEMHLNRKAVRMHGFVLTFRF